MQDITRQNFEAELVNASLAQPVLLDIWAPWCGPCKTLGPVLEKLETDYAGRFKLVKLNADDEPEIAQQLSQMFGVRSIPFCVPVQGRPAGRRLRRRPARGRGAQVPRQARAERRRAGRRGQTCRPPRSCSPKATPTPRSTGCRRRSPPTRPTTRRATTTCAPCSPPAASPRRARPSTRSPTAVVLDPRLAAAGHWLAAMEAAPTARSAGHARRRDRRQQARLRRPLRAGADATSPAASSPRRWTSCSRS